MRQGLHVQMFRRRQSGRAQREHDGSRPPCSNYVVLRLRRRARFDNITTTREATSLPVTSGRERAALVWHRAHPSRSLAIKQGKGGSVLGTATG